jgi:hypothetical protein
VTGCALLPKPTIGPPQIEQTCTGVIVRAPLCAPAQAQQRGGRPDFRAGLRRLADGVLGGCQAEVMALKSRRGRVLGRIPARGQQEESDDN